ncbi:hypothetical protein PULV_a0285 [Pseudoalteromonas ulvae UL12]|nr:hypothetical protein [Pseudoalteromonas ulvae UL12]
MMKDKILLSSYKSVLSSFNTLQHAHSPPHWLKNGIFYVFG